MHSMTRRIQLCLYVKIKCAGRSVKAYAHACVHACVRMHISTVQLAGGGNIHELFHHEKHLAGEELSSCACASVLGDCCP